MINLHVQEKGGQTHLIVQGLTVVRMKRHVNLLKLRRMLNVLGTYVRLMSVVLPDPLHVVIQIVGYGPLEENHLMGVETTRSLLNLLMIFLVKARNVP